ncbi:polysaccharide deacetylase family protein [Neolewinella maritima]|uniref:polysaccharide deacetylase family protein n=1 Tax=Neolewinella maritima TaxID=1383882 RepID=UPI001EE81318|nr:polysaccharide deacetylase family protein [Neolewinella maritima]
MSPPVITVISPHRHPRLRYVLGVIGADLGYAFRFPNDRSVFGTPTPRFAIYYGGDGGGHRLPQHPFLSGQPFAPAAAAVDAHDGLPAFCMTPQGSDLLACIFFALSRYEEYQPFDADTHDRFPGAASHAARHGYLQRPVVREWTAAIGRQLKQWFPDLPPPRVHPPELRLTYDIDLLWAYRYRGWRGTAHIGKDLLTGHPRRALRRLAATDLNDPYNTLPQLERLHRQHGLQATYFWLLTDGTDRHDINPYPIPAAQRALMRSLDPASQQGIHPGYRSNTEGDLVGTERTRMERILDRPVHHSRQHFLRLRFPTTYRTLLQHGITDDHSMGYADRVGWRAGTNLPYPWYDLEREQETKLTVHPFVAMDVTLKNYLQLSGADAGAMVRELQEGVTPYGGPFALLWHNSSFAEDFGWAGWWNMYRDLASTLVERQQVTDTGLAGDVESLG